MRWLCTFLFALHSGFEARNILQRNAVGAPENAQARSEVERSLPTGSTGLLTTHVDAPAEPRSPLASAQLALPSRVPMVESLRTLGGTSAGEGKSAVANGGISDVSSPDKQVEPEPGAGMQANFCENMEGPEKDGFLSAKQPEVQAEHADARRPLVCGIRCGLPNLSSSLSVIQAPSC